MDEATAQTILKLQIQDLQDLHAHHNFKGKAVEGRPKNDEDAAVQLQISEFQKTRHFLSDMVMARSISRAVQDDGAALVVLLAEERRAAQDRAMALQFAGRPTTSAPEMPDSMVDENMLSRFRHLNIDDDDASSCYSESLVGYGGQGQGESSKWASGRVNKRKEKLRTCVACLNTTKVVETTCNHHYCRDCVVRLFEDATMDESLFPTRCCGAIIPLSLVRHFMSVNLIKKVELKAIEHETADRTYCAKADCAAFIDPNRVEGTIATCTICQHKTCSLCKATEHMGPCRKDEGLAQVLQTARDMGWKRCYKCLSIVELSTGCNHMT